MSFTERSPSQSNTNEQPHFTYTGRELDAATGLYYYRARWYDAKTGKFISQDPISFQAGDVNLYRYCGNNPINYVDPSGLWKVNRDGEMLASAESEKGDTIATLAAEVRLEASEFEKWLTLMPDSPDPTSSKDLPIRTRDRGALTLQQLNKDDIICAGQDFLVPNEILAVWGGNAGAFGKWWVAWDTNIIRLRSKGYHVTELENPKAVDFESRIKNDTKNPMLHGIYFWGHGLHLEDGPYVGIALKPAEKGSDKKKEIDPTYESDYKDWQNEYKLGLGWLYACGAAAARDHFSTNADFYGQEGTLVPWPQW